VANAHLSLVGNLRHANRVVILASQAGRHLQYLLASPFLRWPCSHSETLAGQKALATPCQTPGHGLP